MKLELKKELPIIGIILTPFVYLAVIWNSLPERVPIHWDYKGDINGWGSKFSLLLMVFMLPVFMYIIMLVASKFDPKNRISMMGNKFYQLKFLLVLLMSLIAVYIIYSAKNQNFSSPNAVYVIVGAILMVFGNYLKVIQPNYFIGIRTAWTLENTEVWKATHNFAGKLWFIGGLILILGGLIFSGIFFSKILIGFVLVIAFLPVIYSYFKFKSIKKVEHEL